ncbi:polysaccharide deacetylase family protein, partial [Mycobacterium tuberculosis]|nr:polysaccharide deacetylase family protein [Mycobacterium tuberculosis]
LVDIGAHTLSHANLRRLPRAAARAEMAGSADVLADWLGVRPRHFAYPYGYPAAAGPDEFALAAEIGFDLAVTTRPGVLVPEH